MRKAIHLILCTAFASISTLGYGNSEPAPRMWKVEGAAGERIIVLGISHHGSQLEHDSYFHDVVIPQFMQADVLHFEDGGSAFSNQQIECATPLSDADGKATLQSAREIVRRGAVEYFRVILKDLPSGPPAEAVLQDNARKFASGLSEFSVVSVLSLNFSSHSCMSMLLRYLGEARWFKPCARCARICLCGRWTGRTIWLGPIAQARCVWTY